MVLSQDQKKASEGLCKEGKHMPDNIHKKHSKQQKTKMWISKKEIKEKTNKDRGTSDTDTTSREIGSQYSANQSCLIPGTILIPIGNQ